MITKYLTGIGDMWPLHAGVAAYAMNTCAMTALSGFFTI